MAQLSQKVSFYNVDDAEAFVRSAIKAGRVRLSPDEHDDLLAEGLLIMARLAKRYEPGRNGLDPATSRFSGFAAKYLRVKLGDAFHRMQESHRLVTGEDGKRKWQYDAKPSSLDAMVEDNPEGADHVRSLQSEDVYDSGMAHTLRSVLEARWPHDREITVRFGVLMGCDHTASEAARILGIDDREAILAFERIKAVRGKLRKEFAA